ncbi:septum formation family protein [Streptomyces sp. NBC_00162]|uniref:septum formation family protein n=1 Tax=Streptomyces sp. NBC_00162 TaxID=2903629 RepID=UPI00214AA829|nr:septum formation family protein [Streptomyces sp. NBC_00162]UUU41539.1 septum formation family protein [Streptomyces sp. NBC_00162]
MSRAPHLPSQKNNVLAVAAFVFVPLLGLTGALGNGPRTVSVDAQDLRTGDCFNTNDDLKDFKEEGSDTLDPTVSTVPCDEPHEAEVYAVFPLPDGPYPGVKKIVSIGNEKCTATKALTDYVGDAELPDTLNIYFYGPHATSWALDDRDITCFLGYASGTSTGSFRATAP